MLDGQWESGLPLLVGNTSQKLSSGTPGEVSLVIRKFSLDQKNYGDPLWFDQVGYDKEVPRATYLASMRLTLKGQIIPFPESIIERLYEPHWLRIQGNAKRLYIIIDGLDAADSYRAIFTIENGIITQRLIAHGEFSHQIWERTQYHDDFDEHPDRYKNM